MLSDHLDSTITVPFSESLAFAAEPILGSLSDLLNTSYQSGDQTPSDGEVGYVLYEPRTDSSILPFRRSG